MPPTTTPRVSHKRAAGEQATLVAGGIGKLAKNSRRGGGVKEAKEQAAETVADGLGDKSSTKAVARQSKALVDQLSKAGGLESQLQVLHHLLERNEIIGLQLLADVAAKTNCSPQYYRSKDDYVRDAMIGSMKTMLSRLGGASKPGQQSSREAKMAIVMAAVGDDIVAGRFLSRVAVLLGINKTALGKATANRKSFDEHDANYKHAPRKKRSDAIPAAGHAVLEAWLDSDFGSTVNNRGVVKAVFTGEYDEDGRKTYTMRETRSLNGTAQELWGAFMQSDVYPVFRAHTITSKHPDGIVGTKQLLYDYMRSPHFVECKEEVCVCGKCFEAKLSLREVKTQLARRPQLACKWCAIQGKTMNRLNRNNGKEFGGDVMCDHRHIYTGREAMLRVLTGGCQPELFTNLSMFPISGRTGRELLSAGAIPFQLPRQACLDGGCPQCGFASLFEGCSDAKALVVDNGPHSPGGTDGTELTVWGLDDWCQGSDSDGSTWHHGSFRQLPDGFGTDGNGKETVKTQTVWYRRPAQPAVVKCA